MPVWAVVVTAAVLLRMLRWALAPFVLAAIVGLIADPAIRWLRHRTHAPRWIVASGLYVVGLALVSALAAACALTAWRDVSRLAGDNLLPLRQTVAGLTGPKGIDLFGMHLDADGVVEGVKAKARALVRPEVLKHLAPPAFAMLVGLALWAIVSFYAMVSGPWLLRGAVRLLPPRARAGFEPLAPKVLRIFQRYFIGVFAVVVFTALAAWIGYGLVFHVKGAALLALSVGVLESVPIIGPVLGAAIVLLAASQLASFGAVLGMVVYAVALRFVVDDLIAPVVLGRSVAVHPVVVMLAYVVGAVLFGVSGLLLAVPAAACIRLAARTAYGDAIPKAETPDGIARSKST